MAKLSIKAIVEPAIIKQIIDKRIGAYVTGSFIIGGATIESDIDIVLPIDNGIPSAQLERTANIHGGSLKLSEYNNGRKLLIPGLTTINILQLHPMDYAAFMFATETMLVSPIVEVHNITSLLISILRRRL